jgi:3'-phosphoadenosine 5'-phosphosulfate sulfotransferase (PAPS reductase)/FAD synthetase
MGFTEIGEIHQHTDAFKRKLEKSKNLVRNTLLNFNSAYVAVSGGKDSVAMLGIVAEVSKELGTECTAWAHLSDASFPGTIETIRGACEKAGARLVEDWSPVSAFDVVGRGSRVQFGKKGYFFDAIKKFVDSEKKDLAFIGVRKQESARRRTAIKMHGTLFKTTVPSPITVCYPIAYFLLEDVAAAIVHYGLPLHPIYNKAPLMGEAPTYEKIRLGYMTSLDCLTWGGLTFMRVNYPEYYNRLIQAKPELSIYT